MVFTSAQISKCLQSQLQRTWDNANVLNHDQDRHFVLHKIRVCVSEEDNSLLTSPLTMEEVEKVVFRLALNKMPGEDGLPAEFFQRFWENIKNFIFSLVQVSLSRGFMPKSWNTTLLAFIPKCNSPSLPQHYRPISLCTTIYKIVASILVARWRPVLSRAMDEAQLGFLENRDLIDGVMVVQEIWHSMNRFPNIGRLNFMLKLDMEKAYDRVNWNFLFDVLRKQGYEARWLNWIKMCVSSLSYRVIINGRRSESFDATAGLRQGDPLSPFLFISMASALSDLINFYSCKSKIQGFVGHGINGNMLHQMYADDTIIFGQADTRELKTWGKILSLYTKVSGQSINFSKSAIKVSIKHFPLARWRLINKYLKIPVNVNDFTYLGIPIIAGRPKKSNYQPLLDKMRNSLSNWCASYLSFPGRITLIQSVLSTIPSYFFRATYMPKGVLDEIDKITANFLWYKGNHNKRPLRLLNWQRVCSPVERGGLGIRNAAVAYRVLLAKQASKLIWQRSNLWVRFVENKYGNSKLGLTSRSWTWRAVLKEEEYLRSQLMWKVSDGRKVKFWMDPWLREKPLFFYPCTNYPSERMSDNILISEVLLSDGTWDQNFFCHLPEFIRLEIQRYEWGNHEDEQVWKFTGRQKYIPARAYNEIKSMEVQPINFRAPFKGLFTPRIQWFIWRILNNKLQTGEFLASRGLQLQYNCVFCHATNTETIQHIFHNCPIFVIYLQGVSRISGINLLHFDFSKTLNMLGSKEGNHRLRYSSKLPYLSTVWGFTYWVWWKARNELRFKSERIFVMENYHRFFRFLLQEKFPDLYLPL